MNNRNSDKSKYKKPNFVGDLKIVERSELVLPESKIDPEDLDNVDSKPFYNRLVKFLNAVTDPAVIKQAVNCYKSGS